jgi:transposase
VRIQLERFKLGSSGKWYNASIGRVGIYSALSLLVPVKVLTYSANLMLSPEDPNLIRSSSWRKIMKAFPMETRRAVMRAVEEGKLTQEEIADLFGVSSRWVRFLYQRWVSTGRLEPLPHAGGSPPKFTPEVDERVRAYLKQHPDAYLFEIKRDCGLSVTLAAICQT